MVDGKSNFRDVTLVLTFNDNDSAISPPNFIISFPVKSMLSMHVLSAMYSAIATAPGSNNEAYIQILLNRKLPIRNATRVD